MHVPQEIKNRADKLDIKDFEYQETTKNGIFFRRIVSRVPGNTGRWFRTFPIYKEINPGAMIKWWLSDDAIESEAEKEDFEEHFAQLMYHQFMYDLFEIAEVVVKNTTSNDLFKPVIPESACE